MHHASSVHLQQCTVQVAWAGCNVPHCPPLMCHSPSRTVLCDFSGNWLNKFMADFQVTNPSDERLAVTDITGHYMNEGVPLIETSA